MSLGGRGHLQDDAKPSFSPDSKSSLIIFQMIYNYFELSLEGAYNSQSTLLKICCTVLYVHKCN